jgi:hypothetical protein
MDNVAAALDEAVIFQAVATMQRKSKKIVTPRTLVKKDQPRENQSTFDVAVDVLLLTDVVNKKLAPKELN